MILATLVTVLSSSAPTFDGSKGTAFALTLTQDATSPFLLNMSPGVRYTFDIGQDATGGHAFLWPPNTRNMADVNLAAGIRTTQYAICLPNGRLCAGGGAMLNQG